MHPEVHSCICQTPAMCQPWEGVLRWQACFSPSRCVHILWEVSRAQGRLAEHVLTIAAGSLAALSRDRIGETERKPGGEGLKANRMIYWLNRKKGGLVTGERWHRPQRDRQRSQFSGECWQGGSGGVEPPRAEAEQS